jgi:hypothetical protein
VPAQTILIADRPGPWLLALVLVVCSLVALVLLLRWLRHSLLDFCVLVWMTGLCSGLPLLGLAADAAPREVVLLALTTGCLAFCGGVLGLAWANDDDCERPLDRAFSQLVGVFVFPFLLLGLILLVAFVLLLLLGLVTLFGTGFSLVGEGDLLGGLTLLFVAVPVSLLLLLLVSGTKLLRPLRLCRGFLRRARGRAVEADGSDWSAAAREEEEPPR